MEEEGIYYYFQHENGKHIDDAGERSDGARSRARIRRPRATISRRRKRRTTTTSSPNGTTRRSSGREHGRRRIITSRLPAPAWRSRVKGRIRTRSTIIPASTACAPTATGWRGSGCRSRRRPAWSVQGASDCRHFTSGYQVHAAGSLSRRSQSGLPADLGPAHGDAGRQLRVGGEGEEELTYRTASSASRSRRRSGPPA